MKHQGLILLALLLIFNDSASLRAQETAPREYQLEEFVSFNRTISISEALSILGQFSQKYENKVIVESREHTAPINVTVDKMHWKRALEYILRSNDLIFTEHEQYYQIVDEAGGEETEGEKIKWDTREIEINATFFEADYDALSEVGVDWSSLSDGKVKLQVSQQGAVQAGQNMFSATVAYVDKVVSVAALIKVFEGSQLGRVLANPQIRIMDGQEGKIQVGNNFFLTTRDFAGNTRFSEYQAGTILTVTPKILTEGDQLYIHLNIKAEKSSVVQGANGVIKQITDGQTQVLMLDGEETALAGLFSQEENTVRKGLPILKDLPWWALGIRYLTGYNSVTYKKKELVILIKAKIVPSLADRSAHKRRENIYQKRKKQFQENTRRFKD